MYVAELQGKAPQKMSFLFPGTPKKVADPVKTSEVESAMAVESSPAVVGEKVIWGVVSDFSLYEACRMQAVLVGAFRKLGKPQLADDLLVRMRAENWEFRDDHLNRKWDDIC